MLTYEAERLVEVELMQEEVVFVLVVISIGVLPKKVQSAMLTEHFSEIGWVMFVCLFVLITI